jgi:hypothetical protein
VNEVDTMVRRGRMICLYDCYDDYWGGDYPGRLGAKMIRTHTRYTLDKIQRQTIKGHHHKITQCVCADTVRVCAVNV